MEATALRESAPTINVTVERRLTTWIYLIGVESSQSPLSQHVCALLRVSRVEMPMPNCTLQPTMWTLDSSKLTLTTGPSVIMVNPHVILKPILLVLKRCSDLEEIHGITGWLLEDVESQLRL